MEDLVAVPGDPPRELVDRAYAVGAAAVAAPAPVRIVIPTAIRAISIIQIIVGSFCGIAALIMFPLALSAPLGSVRLAVGAAVLYAIPAANLFATSIASLKGAPWARRANVISALLWLALLGACGVWIALGHNRSTGYEVALFEAFLLLALVLAVTVLFAYRRPSVRAAFARRQAP